MKQEHSLGTRALAFFLSIVLLFGMLPQVRISAADGNEARIGDIEYATLTEALAAVPKNAAEATTIELLKSTQCAFDVGVESTLETMNVVLDLGGNELILGPGIGSAGTTSNGIRVLAYSTLVIQNGTLTCSSVPEHNVKVGIANYSELTLNNVTLNAGDLTVYSVNNRGVLNLMGKTIIEDKATANFRYAITNDPYNYYYSNMPAEVNCSSGEVVVGSMQVERYERSTSNAGGVVLNLSAGSFGRIVEDQGTAVGVSYNVTGGTIGVSGDGELANAVAMIQPNSKPVTVVLTGNVTGSFDLGSEDGSAPKHMILDLAGHTLTLAPAVGSSGTVSNGIRVLAKSSLEVRNGIVQCSSAPEHNVKTGIANYSDLVLDDVKVVAGDLTRYTINNRGSLTLKGETVVNNASVVSGDYNDVTDVVAITNDPYPYHYDVAKNASINCADAAVVVGNIQLETYEKAGSIELNISAGSFGKVYKPAGGTNVQINGNITGGIYGSDVTAWIADHYEVVTADGGYQVQYKKDDQTDFGFRDEVPNQWWVGESYQNPAEGGQSSGAVTYAIVDEQGNEVLQTAVAAIDANTGMVTFVAEGSILVRATKAGDAWYNPVTAEYTLQGVKKGQEYLTFEKNQVELVYAEGLTYGSGEDVNSLLGEQGQGTVRYAINEEGALVSENSVAVIDPETGVLTIKTAGKVVVRAIKEGDKHYDSGYAEYTLAVMKAEETFAFAGGESAEVSYGTGEYIIPTEYAGKRALSYEIVKNDDGLNVSVDDTGKVIFADSESKVGRIVVRVSLVEDACYTGFSQEYAVTVSYAQFSQGSYSVQGTMGSNDWYISDIQVSVNDPQRYEISFCNELSTDDWADSVTYSQEGVGKLAFALRDKETGAISEMIDLGEVKLDKTNPVIAGIEFKTTIADEIRKIFFSNTTVRVEFQVSDEQSGVAGVAYRLTADGEFAEASMDENGYYTMIDPEYRGEVEFQVTDQAGRTSVYQKDGTLLVVDGIAPGLAATHSEAEQDPETGFYLWNKNAPFTISFTATDNNIDLQGDRAPVIWVNGVQQILKWTFTEENAAAELQLENDGEYTITGEFYDRAGNPAPDYKLQVIVDREPAKCEVRFRSSPVTTLEGDQEVYTGEQLQAVIYVWESETHFRPERVALKILADGENVTDQYNQGIRFKESWTRVKENGVQGYAYTINFDQEAKYEIQASYLDTVGNNSTNISGQGKGDEFIFDLTSPVNLKIEYSVELEWYQIVVDSVLKCFGFFLVNGENFEPIRVTVSAEDNLSGIAEMAYTVDGSNYTTVESNEAGECVFEISGQYRDAITLKATNHAGLEETLQERGAVVVDTIAPNITTEVIGSQTAVDGVWYTNRENSGMNINIYEENYDLRAQNATVSIVRLEPDGSETPVEQELVWNDIVTDGRVTGGTANLPLLEDGEYRVTTVFSDRRNESKDVKTVIVDKTEPVVQSLAYLNTDEKSEVEGRQYFNKPQTVEITIVERNFRAQDVDVKVEYKNVRIQDNELIEFQEYAQNDANWTHKDDVHILELPFDVDADYTLEVFHQDPANNKSSEMVKQFTVDTQKPQDLTLIYNKVEWSWIETLERMFGFSRDTVEVTVRATDVTAGFDSVFYSIDGQNYEEVKTNSSLSFDLPAEYRGLVDVKVVDRSGNEAEVESYGTLVVDPNAPEIHAELKADSVNEKDRVVYTNSVNPVLRFEVTDENYDLRANEPEVIVNDVVDQSIQWQELTGMGQGDLSLANEGDYSIKANFNDRLNDAEEYQAEIHVDRTKPVILSVEYMTEVNGELVPAAPVPAEPPRPVDGIAYYDKKLVAVLTIAEHNFDPEGVNVVISAKDLEGNEVENTAYFKEYAKDKANWSFDGDLRVLQIPLDKDAIYTFDVACDDLALNSSEDYEVETLVVDTAAPEVTVSWNELAPANGTYYNADRTMTIRVEDQNFYPEGVTFYVQATDVNGDDVDFDSTLDWVPDGAVWTAQVPFDVDANYTVELRVLDRANQAGTFNDEGDTEYTTHFTVDKVAPSEVKVEYSKAINTKESWLFYNKDGAMVTLTASDMTSGVDCFSLDVDPEDINTGATSLTMPEDLVIGADGKIRSGSPGFIDQEKITVTNNNGTAKLSFPVPPAFRGEFVVSAADRSTNASNKADDDIIVVVDQEAPGRTVSYTPARVVNRVDMTDREAFTEDDQVVLYYDRDAVIRFEVTEANFFPEDVKLKVNGEAVSFDTEHWLYNTPGSGVYENTLTLREEGDYVVSLEYTDKSTNEMKSYTSQTIVIDKTAPQISVAYGNTDVKKTGEDGREYYAAEQTAVITIKEENFRASDVVLRVTAVDVAGNSVLAMDEDLGIVAAYYQQGFTQSNWSPFEAGTWRREDDTYVLELKYSTDANYTFDVEYTDLARNPAADYAMDRFTVDTQAPDPLQVEYSTAFFSEILEDITFGYYNAKMTVTISATDRISGVDHFDYSYINSANVSSVNAQLLNQAIACADRDYSNGGATATVSFEIPKMVLENDNQFNGTVEFTATDRSMNTAKKEDNHRIIVDNISPTAVITYNEPAQEVGGVSYYAGNIDCTIVVTEANFFRQDVNVTVTKDGVSYPVSVSWVDNSVDHHTGTFTLTEQGDYIVSVQYADRSGNRLAVYTSGQLTVDTTRPTIEVTDVRANSANKDETYGFTITVEDINLDVANAKLALEAVVMTETGIYDKKSISLGKAEEVIPGQKYTYTVENLTEDALYTLTGYAVDFSGNSTDELMLLAEDKAYSTVQFSINRHGSIFVYGDAETEKLVNDYYVYTVGNDVVIDEINVDPIENYTITLNGRVLEEGVDKDFVSESSNDPAQWSKRTYRISKELFAEEGEYNLIISSVDSTGTTAYSDVKNLRVAFTVDRTDPEITISGLEEGGRYETIEHTVTLIPSDEGGRLSEVLILLLDSHGNPVIDEVTGEDISVRFHLSGDELDKYLEENGGVVTFTIPEGLEHGVQIICRDYTVGADGKANEYNMTFDRVTVSQNKLVIFYANKPLFYGTIGGGLVLLLLIILLFKRRKRDKDEKTEMAKA